MTLFLIQNYLSTIYSLIFILEKSPINNIEDMIFMCCMTLSFSVFLWISEFLNLKKSDLKLIEKDQTLKINIESLKNDQFGKRTFTYFYNND